MDRISAKERLKMMLYGNFDGALPTQDDGIFQLYSAISLVKVVTNMVDMTGNYKRSFISFSDDSITSHNARIRYYIRETEKLMVKYIYEYKGFKGWNKEKQFAKWHHDMLAKYQQNADEWAETIRKKAKKVLYLISIFSLMSVTPYDE